MPTKDQVLEALSHVSDPEIGKPITELDMVREITIDGPAVVAEILLTIPGCPLKDRIQKDVSAAIGALDGVDRVEVVFDSMSDEQRQALVSRLRSGQPTQQDRPIGFWQDKGATTRAILIASGKGGVGKSSVTANLAVALAQLGKRVGVVDADVYGFSQPGMLGVMGRPTNFNGMALPLEGHGVKVISIGFLIPEDQPVIWRGPMLHKMIQQFLADVYWGDLDYVLVDMPPGTGDVSISLAQYLPGAEMIVVTTPQEAAQKVAVRAGKMTEQVDLKVLGVVENMSFFLCPSCNEKHRIFGEGGGKLLADAIGAELLGEIPLDNKLRVGADEGKPLVVTEPESPGAAAIIDIAQQIEAKKPSMKGRRLPVLGPTGGGHQH